jgi:hypothetical protein
MGTVRNGCDAGTEKAARRRGSRRHINEVSDTNACTVGAASRVDADDGIRRINAQAEVGERVPQEDGIRDGVQQCEESDSQDGENAPT